MHFLLLFTALFFISWMNVLGAIVGVVITREEELETRLHALWPGNRYQIDLESETLEPNGPSGPGVWGHL